MNDSFQRSKSWLVSSGLVITEKENENLGGVYSYYDEKTKSYGFLYPEITGYFLSTLRFLHSLEPNDDLVKLAKNSANWLIKIHQNYVEKFGDWKVCSTKGKHLIDWLLHFFSWQTDDVLKKCRKVAMPTSTEESEFRKRLGDNIVDGIKGRIEVAMLNSEAQSKKLYYEQE